MKVFILAVCLTLSGLLQARELKGQDLDKVYVSLQLKNSDLKAAFKKIETLTAYRFTYKSEDVARYHNLTYAANKVSLEKVLHDLLKSTDLGFEQVDNAIIIKKSVETVQVPNPQPAAFPPVSIAATVSGRVTDTTGTPLPGASVYVKGTGRGVVTNEKGEFAINAQSGDQLIVSFIGYIQQTITVTDNLPFQNVVLHANASSLNEVVVSTGYQDLPKERATGSFVQIDNRLINRSVSTNILDRLNGVTSGLIFNNNNAHQFQQATIEIRGRATLFSNPNPLVIVDNFPYDGDITNINPNDVESITILKDAAAASAWGSRSGNGVIVITTKKGRLNLAPTVSVTANTTIGAKPNLYYRPQLSSTEYIGVEQFLFNKGAYNNTINNGYSAISPAVEVFLARRNGAISVADSLAQLNTLKGYDVRQQLLKYFYRPSVNQQYQASISGGTTSQKYFISAGYDNDLNNSVGSTYDRVTLNASNTYYFLKNKLELFSNLIYTGSKTKSGTTFQPSYPYTQAADANGNPLPVANTLRLSYASTAGNGKLLNWLYEPLDELNNGYSTGVTNQTDYRINVSLTYKILKGLKASALYSYEKGITETNTVNELQSYYTRNLINTFTQIDPVNGTVTYPIPLGGILNNSQTDISSNDGRFQLNYENVWGKHALNVVAGAEIDNYNSLNNTYAFYGYNPETGTNLNSAINFTGIFNNFYNGTTVQINPNTSQFGAVNRFVSEYFNGSYIYDEKYIVSLSGRRDESNLFGVSENQKGVPLWSTGIAWVANKESFYKIDWLPQLKVRATYGYTGNVNTSISAYLTAMSGTQTLPYNQTYNLIVNPPNPSLRWEKDQNINIGIDFGIKGNRLNGSIDYWRKNGMDLIGNSPIAPQTGITLYTGNSANTLTKGIDVQLNSINLNGAFKWFTTLLYNQVQNRVTNYKVSNGTNLNVVSSNYTNPLQGYPYYSIFSFKYAGLNSLGNPQGYLNGQISTSYSGIMNSTNRNELVYNGSATPTSFGSLRNTFDYKGFDLSFNIMYKFGYYFRRSSLNNSSLYNAAGGASSYQQADYENRWQKPGDELTTNVPALIYPANTSRTNLYTYSNVLVEKGDNIRLQDIRFGYTVNTNPRLPFKNLNFFTYINNVGILWRANKYHIDPDYPTGIPVPRTIALGVKADL